MTQAQAKSIPLPVAVLALSVAVCIGSGLPAAAEHLRPGQRAQDEQRETLEHLLDAIQQAAKKLSDRLDGQAAHLQRSAIRPVLSLIDSAPPASEPQAQAIQPLRDTLLNLPPPTC